MLFAVGLAIWVGAALAMDAAGRRADALRRDYSSRSIELYEKLRIYGMGDPTQLDADLNDGKPLPRQELATDLGPAVRMWIEGERLGDRYRGWTARVDFGAGTPGWMRIEIYPPEPQRRFGPWYASRGFRSVAETIRLLLIILAGTTCGGCMLLLVLAPVARRQIGQVCAAAALLVLIAWLLDPHRPGLLTPRTFTWIPIGALGAIALSLAVALIPSRKPRAPNQCDSCGYDLTGNVSGICPECGTPI